MSDSESGGSVVGDIIAFAALAGAVYLFALGMPVLPYFDVVLHVILDIYKPSSTLGTLFFMAFLFLLGWGMLTLLKMAGEYFFHDRVAMYFFLYGQSFFVIALVGKLKYFALSHGVLSLLAEGFNDTLDYAQNFLIIVGLVLMGFGVLIEKNMRKQGLNS